MPYGGRLPKCLCTSRQYAANWKMCESYGAAGGLPGLDLHGDDRLAALHQVIRFADQPNILGHQGFLQLAPGSAYRSRSTRPPGSPACWR